MRKLCRYGQIKLPNNMVVRICLWPDNTISAALYKYNNEGEEFFDKCLKMKASTKWPGMKGFKPTLIGYHNGTAQNEPEKK